MRGRTGKASKPKAKTEYTRHLERSLKGIAALDKARRVNTGIVGRLLQRIEDAKTLMGSAQTELKSKIYRIGGGDSMMAGTMEQRASLAGSGKLERAAQDLELLQDILSGIILDIRQHADSDSDDDDDDRRKPRTPSPTPSPHAAH